MKIKRVGTSKKNRYKKIHIGIRLIGVYVLTLMISIIGFLMWNKNELISKILMILGVVLTIFLVIMEVFFRKKDWWEYVP